MTNKQKVKEKFIINKSFIKSVHILQGSSCICDIEVESTIKNPPKSYKT